MANKSLYVGNLPYSTTESDLLETFSAFGAVTSRVIEGRGFGFVDVPAESADEAISVMHGKDVGGRTLTVNEARPRENDRGGGAGGGGGGGGRGRW